MDSTRPHTITASLPARDWRDARLISSNWETFEWMFGCVLPIVCFALEQGALGGLTPLGRYRVLLLPFVGAEIALFAWWKLWPVRSVVVSTLVAGALAIGAFVAGLIGFVLLPISAIGVLFLIGFLGFVPFGTAIAFGRVAERTCKYAALQSGRASPALLALGVLTVCAPFGAVSGFEIWVFDATIARLERGDADCVHDSIERLNDLPWFDEDRLVDAYGDIADERARERISLVYEGLTGNSIEERLALLNY